jgi:hypothetical protein
MDFEINPILNSVFLPICKHIAEEWVNSGEEPSEDSDSETECQETDRPRHTFSDEEDQKFREAVLKKHLSSFDGEFDLLAADNSDLDSFEDKDFGNLLPTHRSRNSKRPSKANRAKPAEEVDDCRPHSEKNQFSLLKESKKKLQLAQINLVSPKEYYGKMAKKSKNEPAPGSDRTRARFSRTRAKNSPRQRRDSVSLVAGNLRVWRHTTPIMKKSRCTQAQEKEGSGESYA